MWLLFLCYLFPWLEEVFMKSATLLNMFFPRIFWHYLSANPWKWHYHSFNFMKGHPVTSYQILPKNFWRYHSAIPPNMTLSQCHQVKRTSQTKRKASDVGNLWHLVIRTKHSRGLRPQIKRANQESDQHAMLAVQFKLQIARVFFTMHATPGAGPPLLF